METDRAVGPPSRHPKGQRLSLPPFKRNSRGLVWPGLGSLVVGRGGVQSLYRPIWAKTIHQTFATPLAAVLCCVNSSIFRLDQWDAH